jgi:hypothetical protein
MTTKPAAKIQPAQEGSAESIAYASIEGIPTADPHDRDRLGFNLFLWLTQRRDPLDIAVRTAGVRFLISEEEALRRIREGLTARGVQL